jgi:hypothetical protein
VTRAYEPPKSVVVHEPPPDPVKLHLLVLEHSVNAAALDLRRARDAAAGPHRRRILAVERQVQALRLELLEEAR